jgi:hypothetical protein
MTQHKLNVLKLPENHHLHDGDVPPQRRAVMVTPCDVEFLDIEALTIMPVLLRTPTEVPHVPKRIITLDHCVEVIDDIRVHSLNTIKRFTAI